MHIIKLNTTTSTNAYLKELNRQIKQENFTTVWALSQTQGKGQRGTVWVDEPGNTLTFSVLLRDLKWPMSQIFEFNIAVAHAVYAGLKQLQIPDLTIKWPNDILSDARKIGGILIETSVHANGFDAVVGIGINVNQTAFSDFPQAGSLRMQTGKSWDLEHVLQTVLNSLYERFTHVEAIRTTLWDDYYRVLFRKGQWTDFEKADGTRMKARISRVTPQGRLVLEEESGAESDYEIKEIKMLY